VVERLVVAGDLAVLGQTVVAPPLLPLDPISLACCVQCLVVDHGGKTTDKT